MIKNMGVGLSLCFMIYLLSEVTFSCSEEFTVRYLFWEEMRRLVL